MLGTQGLLRSRPAGRRAPASTTSRRARCTATSTSDDRRDAFTEESPYRPRTPYNASKAGGDHVVRAYHETCGPADHDHELRQQLRPLPVPGEGASRYFTTLALARTSRCRCTRRRENRREWIHAIDHCRAIDADPRPRAGWARPTTSAPAWSRASRRSPTRSWPHLGKPESLKTIVPDRPGHDRRYVLDWSKISRELGWEPHDRLRDEGIAETIDWYAANRDVVGAAARPGPGGRGHGLDSVTAPPKVSCHRCRRAGRARGRAELFAAAGWDVIGLRPRRARHHRPRPRCSRRSSAAAPDAVVNLAAWNAVDAGRRRSRRRPSPSTPWRCGHLADGCSPVRRPALPRLHRLRVRRDPGSTAYVRVGSRPTRCRCTAVSKAAGETRGRPGCAAWCARRGCAVPRAPTW